MPVEGLHGSSEVERGGVGGLCLRRNAAAHQLEAVGGGVGVGFLRVRPVLVLLPDGAEEEASPDPAMGGRGGGEELVQNVLGARSVGGG